MKNDGSANSVRLVRDLMKVGVPTCSTDIPVHDLARLILESNLEAVVVLNPQNGHAMGVVSQLELVSAYSRANCNELKAEDIMRDGVPQSPPDIPLEAAAQIMLDLGVRALFQMHHAGGIEYPAAMLTFNHLIRHLSAMNEAELGDLGVKAAREAPLDAFFKRRDEARALHVRSKANKPHKEKE